MDMTKHKTFRERNLTMIAVVSVVTLALLILGSFRIADIPLISGNTYTARFSESGGLKVGDPVQVAGVTVGKVKGIDLDRAAVVVQFTVKDVDLGDQTAAAIKTGTLLGARYISLTPRGDGELKSGAEIPLDRTAAPYNLTDSLAQVAEHTKKLDLDSVAAAMTTFSDTFRQTSDELTPAFEGVTELSRVISSRDKALRELFTRAKKVTGTFRERTDQIKLLIRDGNLIMVELIQRRQVIERLIKNASGLAEQVTGLVKDNQRQLRPAMKELNKVLAILNKNEENISVSLHRASIFLAGLGEGVGHGPWFNGHLELPTGQIGLPSVLNGLTGQPGLNIGEGDLP
ncbi:MCE family protein [Nocardioides sp. GCM10030258]|uniref:MCE family protein n=1 Tax=unclassified Nocardioides TaxID=2615069 RepID=UPI00361BF3D6